MLIPPEHSPSSILLPRGPASRDLFLLQGVVKGSPWAAPFLPVTLDGSFLPLGLSTCWVHRMGGEGEARFKIR